MKDLVKITDTCTRMPIEIFRYKYKHKASGLVVILMFKTFV